ncbi:MAG: zinc-dependent metalloprotease [Phycisphaerales bacterium JB039]
MRTQIVTGAMALTMLAGLCAGQDAKPEFPDFKDVAKDYEKVVSTADDKGFYTLWVREKDGQMLAELPRGWQNQEHYFAMTVATGEMFAGLQGQDLLVTWKRFDKRLALIEPNVEYQSTGGPENKDAVQKSYTDRVILDIPIVCIGPGGQPVIDMDDLLLDNAQRFFGFSANGLNQRLATVAKAKTFPENTEIAFEAPVAGGVFKTLHYSLSKLRSSQGFKPREADSRVGYFLTSFRDLGELSGEEIPKRYITRWHLEKRDPKLKLSPPKEPIVFYIDHTVPVAYRRFVREGLEYWNEAFEAVGFVNAIEVRQQDKVTGAFMDLDPEDVRYNFIRWVTNEVGLAIGPSRAHPRTGEILDADVVVSDGWVRAWEYEFSNIMPQFAMESFSPETLAWLDKKPQWDPRIRLAEPAQREYLLAQRERRGVLPYGGHPIALSDPEFRDQLKDEEGMLSRLNLPQGMCQAAAGKAFEMAMARMHLELGLLGAEPEGETIDGMPEDFVGPLLADLIAHEVGHTLGLRHNFKASSAYSLEQINSEEFKGNKPMATSVMDYLPTNINAAEDGFQGDYAMIGIGPYDMWAIEYGYTTDEKALPEILKRCSEPELQYATDEDTGGPDPLARRYDFAAEPLDYAESTMELARYHRASLLEKFVEDGEPWSKARRGYEITLGQQMRMVSMMANWIGGAHVVRDKKGDPGERVPVTPVDAEAQRAALEFVIENSFYDEAFGLTPQLIRYLTVEKWSDDGSASQDPAWRIHDRIMGLQASVMTMLMNPTTLQRVFDNEYIAGDGEDAVTLPELLETVYNATWSELADRNGGEHSARSPMISSLRRNLQREHLDRLIEIENGAYGWSSASSNALTNLVSMQLRQLNGQIERALRGADRLDPYTRAHLEDA